MFNSTRSTLARYFSTTPPLVQTNDARQYLKASLMRIIPRSDFLVNPRDEMGLLGRPVPIGYNTTISASHVHKFMLHLMKDKLEPSANVMDIGVGSGYLTACMAHCVMPQGRVVAIDHVPELLTFASDNIAKFNPFLNQHIEYALQDGRLPYKPSSQEMKFDIIHIGASTQNVYQHWLDLLADNGILIASVGKEYDDQCIFKYMMANNNNLPPCFQIFLPWK
jgi:protein-L-isoaspartate(D-aspartate) O-methyltransferase